MDPYTNHLNAETATGISIANQMLDASSGARDNGFETYLTARQNMPPGISMGGFLDEDED